MDVLILKRFGFLFLIATLQPGCMAGYLARSGYHQLKILNNRVPIEELLQDEKFPEEKKRKLRLAIEARQFAENELGLKPTKNYSTYVELDRPYVSYIVSVAENKHLKAYHWNFPLVGALPYKGYFSPEAAQEEAARYDKTQYDTYVRGASAYSTLGWFDDPILSSMMTYKDHQLVNLIIHESVHATLYIKSQADFNEQMASYLGDLGAQLFYIQKEGPKSPTAELVAKERRDADRFSKFLTDEIKSLEKWYEETKPQLRSDEEKKARLEEIQKRFTDQVLKTLETDSYSGFPKLQLNNALLLSYGTYSQDYELFEKLYEKTGRDVHKLVQKLTQLEKSKDPKKDLRERL